MTVFKISDIPEFSKKDRIVVVGVIGKSPYRYPNKTTPLLPSVNTDENGIECHWDERRGVLYLHAVTYLDTKQLAKLAESLDENSKSTEKDADAAHWLVASGELAADSCRIIALLFHLCHIVVLSHPTPVFDLGYLQLFKAIDAYRTELSGRTTAATASFGGAWESHGRSCCPRLVFHCGRAPAPLRRAPAALKRLEHAVEDQLYFILRKARIITNVCAKSLFAIPKNEEFVYINAEDMGSARDVGALVRGLMERCAPTFGTGPAPTAGSAPNTGSAPNAGNARATFKQFLQAHIDLAFGEGFDDNVGKYAMTTSFFELPSAATWRAAALALAPIYLAECADDDGGALFDALATDVRFSQARCAKVLPIAQASYAEGLPSHYSSQHHAHKVSVALGVLDSMARGPVAGAARAKLRTACRQHHRARRLCEAPSLTRHVCVLPDHDNTKEHSSGVRYVSACNCGRTKCSREDPYTVKRANYTFYVQAAEECGVCPTLPCVEFPVFQPSTPTFNPPRPPSSESDLAQTDHTVKRANYTFNAQAAEECGVCPTLPCVEFPVFQPSTPTFKAASVKGESNQDNEEKTSRGSQEDQAEVEADAEGEGEGDVDAEGEGEGEGPWSVADALSPGSLRDEDASPASDGYVVPVRGGTAREAVMARQPSTTEYLPGMLHALSPPGLLPSFPSWSLVCLGASSLYSHSAGLPEHLQPGFLPHTNYLLPWDCAVRMEQASLFRAGGSRGRGKAAGAHHLTVKIFIGFEYECPRGHRFMMASPDTVVSGGGGGVGREAGAAGARLAASDMPLHAACPCRAPHAAPAQLTRLHVVTPKAPVHVTLQPQVQPVPGGPIFVPLPAGSAPIKLSASAYWVLRLPRVYADERGVLPRARPPGAPPAPAPPGVMLAPIFGLQD